MTGDIAVLDGEDAMQRDETGIEARIRAVTGGLLPAEESYLLPDGRTMQGLVWGSPRAPAAVCLHGAGAHAHWWTAMMSTLAADWCCHALDLRGHGRSPWAEPPSYQVRDFLSDVAVVLEWSFRAPVIVVGHSMGGRVAARLAAERPELVRALVLLDPRVSPADEEAVSRWNETFLAQRHGRSHDTRDSAEQSFRVLPEEPGIPDAIVALLARHAVVERRPGEWALCSDRAALAVYGDRIGGMLDVLGRISCPTLLACGAETHIMTPADARAYAAALHKGQLATVPGRHHFLLSHPAEAAAAARSFLERLG